MLFGPAIRNIQVRYFIDHDSDHRRALFISGMGRSGTTWLAELLNFRNDSRFVFEPFDPGRVALAVNFGDHTYLRPSDDDRRFLAPAQAIVTGLVRDPFVDQHNRRVICSRRIIKEVRASLFLRWLYEHFPGMPIVEIIRHPFAVAVSRLATNIDIDLQDKFLSQPNLVRDYLGPYVDIMRACATPFERHVAAWCVEVGIPLSQFRPGEICVVFYEHLCVDPARVLAEVFAHANQPFNPRVCNFLTKPSKTTLSKSDLARNWSDGSHRITQAWMERVSKDQIRRGLALLEEFGLSDLFDERPLPLVERLELPRAFRLRPFMEDKAAAVT